MTEGRQADYARHRGVSSKTVSVWKREGRLVFTAGGLVDFEASDAALAAAGKGNGVRRVVTAADPALPPGLDFLEGVPDDFDRGAGTMGVLMMYRLPARAASLALAAGAPLNVAFVLYKAMRHAAAMAVADIMREQHVEPLASDPDAPFIHAERFDDLDWPQLAEEAGVPFDLAGWEAHFRAAFGAEAEAA